MRNVVLVLVVLVAGVRASHAQCKIPGFGDAAFGDNGVTLTGNACTDSYDSSVAPGTYAGTKCTSVSTCVGGVGTNAINSGGIGLTGNACVKGNCQIGYGGATTSISGSAGCAGTAVEPAKVNLSSVTAPVYPNASPFNITSPATMTPSKTYGTVTGSGNSSNVITLSAGTYVLSSLKLSGQSSLKITSGPVYVYVTGSGSAVDLSGNGINNTTGVATNLIFMCSDTVTSASIVGNGTASFGFYCPKAAVSVTGNGDVYGAIVGKTVSMVGNGTVHYDKALGSLTSSQLTCSPTEVSRATPVLASLTPDYGGSAQTAVVQGTYEMPTGSASTITTTSDITGWAFPYITGHMRARISTSITTTASTFSGTVCTGSGTPSGCSVLFDVGATGNIPAMTFTNAGCTSPSGTCRYLFTNTNAAPNSGLARLPVTSTWSANSSATIGPLIASTSSVPGITLAQQQTIMQKVLQAKLGGVDRSTVAVIGASTIAGSGTRPTIAYFGATDGMLHAVCASKTATGPCAGRVGTELWAFMPRVQLPLLRTNTARIDGSPNVVDAFGDFDNDGLKTWATILVFQTGYGTGTKPATYALDITDPTAPKVLWERIAPTTVSATELGTGLTVGSGRVGTASTSVAVVVTNNGGSGGPGVVATSLELETGATQWKFGWLYPTVPRSVSADGPLPGSAIPGGAVGVDLKSSNRVTDFVFGDIYGNLWRVDAATGVSANGSQTPLFSFSTNKHPIGVVPTVYSNGNNQYAVVASGGYADQTGSATWRAATQYIVAVKLASTATVAVNETGTKCSTCAVAFAIATTSYGFSQALVVGGQLFVTLDSGDVNATGYGGTANTGTLQAVNLATLGSTTTVIASGGSGIANAGTTLVSSSGQKQQQAATATGTTGNSVDITTASTVARLLWLRLE